jgi:hypothetical protein
MPLTATSEEYGKGKVRTLSAMKACRGSSCVALFILGLCTRWTLVVNSTFQSLYPWQETPVPVEYEAECPPEPVGPYGRRGKFLAPTGIQTVDRPASSIVGIATSSLLQNMPTRVLLTVTVTKMLSLQRRITDSAEFHSGTHVGMHRQTDSFPWKNAKLGRPLIWDVLDAYRCAQYVGVSGSASTQVYRFLYC